MLKKIISALSKIIPAVIIAAFCALVWALFLSAIHAPAWVIWGVVILCLVVMTPTMIAMRITKRTK